MMKRGGFLRRRTRLRPVSDKVRKGKPEFDRVYAEVDARSEGRCEVSLPLMTVRMPGSYIQCAMKRCTMRQTERHHTRKPRRLFHAREWVIGICRTHHDMCSAAYKYGRLVIEPNGYGLFACRVVTKASKFSPEEGAAK